jgi:MoxR-like ATPase
MKSSGREHLPLAPLLHGYTTGGPATPAQLFQAAGLGPRFEAIQSATVRFLYTDFLDNAATQKLSDAVCRFHDAVVRSPLHTEAVRLRIGFLRHGLAYFLRGRDSPALKMEAVLSPTGTYHVPGLGPSFWSAVLQSCNPLRHPGWTPGILQGLDRLCAARFCRGAGAAEVCHALISFHDRVRERHKEMTAQQIDHFLSLVAVMPGRNPLEGADALGRCPVEEAVRKVRATTPLRQRLKDRGRALAEAQRKLEAGLAGRQGKILGDALTEADPVGSARCGLDWGMHGEVLTLWVGRLWEADDPYPVLERFWTADELPGAGLWLPAAVLHLRDPQRYGPWDENTRRGWEILDEVAERTPQPAERYRWFNEALRVLRERHALHPLEVPPVLAALAPEQTPCLPAPLPHPGQARLSLPQNQTFTGFCADTFRFLGELGQSNRRTWMEQQRDRYAYVVRQPLTDLCRALAKRYVGPVLCGSLGWDLDIEARNGRALTSICKNDYGRSSPYNTALWITFAPTGQRRTGPQLFVRLSASGLWHGLRLGRSAREARGWLRQNVERHGERLFRLLRQRGALGCCSLGNADEPISLRRLESPAELRTWAAGRSQEVSVGMGVDDPRLADEELIGCVLLTFDALLPLFACCREADAGPALDRLSGETVEDGFEDDLFTRETFLGRDWLRRALDLLGMKRQLILQGVPGTGKTHVARHLARHLARGREDAIRLIQFHPAYSYEEFVEGIRVRSVAVEGRHDVTYPVEDGLLCSFAARAAAAPSRPHVLVIDEINRGNLPRIFGELLYLLEYREQALDLPYSRRSFRLPNNLYLLATMNAADRSVAIVDQALRRRFSFLEMQPDAGILSAWLKVRPPAAGPEFADRVLALFDRLNTRLRNDLGAHAQVGHSYFMIEGLDEHRLAMVWRHHVRPLLEEHFFNQPARVAAYDGLLESDERPRSRRQPTGVTE